MPGQGQDSTTFISRSAQASIFVWGSTIPSKGMSTWKSDDAFIASVLKFLTQIRDLAFSHEF